jgi:hypothetical protein
MNADERPALNASHSDPQGEERSGVYQADDKVPDMPAAQGHDDCARCAPSRLLRVVAETLESRGLDSRLVDYPGDADDDEHVEEIVIVNPAARERGEVRVGDDGSVTWDYFGRLDKAGVGSIVDEVTNALRAPGVRFGRDPRS